MLNITDLENMENKLVNLVYGDTDSLYMSYDGLLNTIEGVETMTLEEKRDIIARINQEFLDKFNEKLMDDYYASRHVESCHKFELETIAKAGIWLDVKKRYAQILLWKDGHKFDTSHLPLKAKGMEIVKASYPKAAREMLKKIIYNLIDTSGNAMNETYGLVGGLYEEWMQLPVEAMCPSISVNGYKSYVISDNDPKGVMCHTGTPFQVRGLALYNWFREVKKLPGDPIYGGKMRYYVCRHSKRRASDKAPVFVFQAGKLPDWALKEAPIDREAMFRKCVLDPLNRVLTAIGLYEVNINGGVNVDLFGDFI